MSTRRPRADDLGTLFVAITGETTLTERQDATARTGHELRSADVETLADFAAAVGETGLDDALASPEVE